MGMDINFTCKTCGVNYQLGRPGRCDKNDLLVHPIYGKSLAKHQNHDSFIWSYELPYNVIDGDLWYDDGYRAKGLLSCKGYSQFKQVDLEEIAGAVG